MKYKTLQLFAAESGYTIRDSLSYMNSGVWAENEIWTKNKHNQIVINVQNFELWVENKLTRPKTLKDCFDQYVFDEAHILSSAIPFDYDSPPLDSGVYFLIDDNAIVYAGLSVCLQNRLAAHHEQGIKQFSHYWCVTVEEESWLPKVESYYINKFLPKYNRRIPVPYPRKAPNG